MQLSDLKPAPYNPRTITPEAVAGLKTSIVQFGDISGIVWNRRSGHLVSGHQRLAALKALHGDRLQLVDCGDVVTLRTPDGQSYPVRVVDWDEMTEMAANIAANNPNIGGAFDDEKLDTMMQDLRDWNPDLCKDLLLDNLLKDPSKRGNTDPDEEADPAELPAEPVTKPGDLWILGPHRLLCGDSTREADVARLMGTDRAGMAFTDPPYNVAYEGAAGAIMNDDLGAGFGAFLEAALRNLLAFTDGGCYVFMSSSELDVLQAAFRRAGGHWSTFLIWTKDTFTIGRSDYQRQYEPCLYGWREGSKHHWCGDRDQGDVWRCEKPMRSTIHPTTKPVDLVVRAVRNSSKPGDVVLDLFGGSGSTLIACECSERRARLMELDPKFCDAIVARWEKFSGKKAVRA